MKAAAIPDASTEYRARLRAMASQVIGKDVSSLGKMDLIEAVCKVSFDRDVWKQTAMSFECQLYMADPGNPAFSAYPPERLAAMDKTVELWKKEIEDAQIKVAEKVDDQSNERAGHFFHSTPRIPGEAV